jgi:predicted dehydrogenase
MLDQVGPVAGNLNCWTDATLMIDRQQADAIIVATPAVSHAEICAKALSLNLCVLLEKPVATSAAAARRLLASVAVSKGFVMPGHVLRFSKDHQRLVEIVRSGRIGEVIYVSSRRYRDESHAIRYADTDPVFTTLVHDIDLAQWITLSDFRSVRAHRSRGAGFRSMTTASAITETGIACELRTAWTFSEGELPRDRLEVVGSRGCVELTVGEALVIHCGGRRIDLGAFDGDDPLRSEQDHFLECVRDRSRKPALDLQQAISGLELAEAAIESLRLGRGFALCQGVPEDL